MSLAVILGAIAASAQRDVLFVGGMICPRTPSSTADSSHAMAGNLVGGISSTPVEGDFVVVFYGSGSTNNQSVKAIKDTSAVAYTSRAAIYANATNDANLAVAYRRLGPSPDTTIVLGSQGGANCGGGAIVLVFRGVNASTPFDVTDTTASLLTTGRPNPPSITPVTAGSVIIGAGAHGGPSSGNANLTTSDLLGFLATQSTGTARSGGAAAGYKPWTGGAFDPAQFGGGTTGATDAAIGYTLVLRP